MRRITVRYQGECTKCGETLEPGTEAAYEKKTGIFCPGCVPTDTEEIRAFRQDKADAKADRYDEWAAKRYQKVQATLDSHRQFTGDIAFNTQPGYISMRARIIAQEDRARESMNVASKMADKADRLRHVVVAGDAEARHEAARERTRQWIKKGMRVETVIYGPRTVLRVNKKTATVNGYDARTFTVDLGHISYPLTSED